MKNAAEDLAYCFAPIGMAAGRVIDALRSVALICAKFGW
jgi:hypothetical protein